MKKLFAVAFSLLFLFGLFAPSGFSKYITKQEEVPFNNIDDFYFVQITDTHVLHSKFDGEETSTNRLKHVLGLISSFPEKPVFVVITGDLVDWGGMDPTGALNYQAFKSCFFEKNDLLYADPDYSIPVYLIPGNHDYMWENCLVHYKNYLNEETKYTITYNDVSLFFMDSGFNYISHPGEWALIKGSGFYDEDVEWLTDELDKCTSEHKIILMHHPAVSKRNERTGEMEDVIARNRVEFVELCERYEVDLVLNGHTHANRIFDADENRYDESVLPINCSEYPTLFVQTSDCKKQISYRNISFIDDDIQLQPTHNESYKARARSKDIERLELKDSFRNFLSNIIFPSIRRLL